MPVAESVHIHHRDWGWRSRGLIVELSQHVPRFSKYADVGLSR